MRRLTSAIVLAFATFAATPASADNIVWLDICAPDTASCTGGNPLFTVGLVRFTLDNGAVTVQAHSRAFGENGFGFNLAGPSDGLSIVVSPVSRGWTLGGNDEAIGPFGSFEYLFDGPPFVSGVAPFELRFTMTRDAGFLSPFDVFAMNELGYMAAAHAKFLDSGTYFHAGSEVEVTGVVPEPTSMLLLGSGLVAAWRARRRHS